MLFGKGKALLTYSWLTSDLPILPLPKHKICTESGNILVCSGLRPEGLCPTVASAFALAWQLRDGMVITFGSLQTLGPPLFSKLCWASDLHDLLGCS